MLAALSDRLHLPDWLTEEGWWQGEVEREREVYVARADRLLDALRDTHDPDDVVGAGPTAGSATCCSAACSASTT